MEREGGGEMEREGGRGRWREGEGGGESEREVERERFINSTYNVMHMIALCKSKLTER